VLKNGIISCYFDVEKILGSSKVLVYCSTGRVIMCRCNKEIEQVCFSLKEGKRLASFNIIAAAQLKVGMKTKKVIFSRNCIELIFENFVEEEPILIPREFGVSIASTALHGTTFSRKFSLLMSQFVYEQLGRPKRVVVYANKGIMIVRKSALLQGLTVSYDRSRKSYIVRLCQEAANLIDLYHGEIDQVYFERGAVTIIFSNYEGAEELFRVCD